MLGAISLPLESVQGIIFQPPALPQARDALRFQLADRTDDAGRTLDADRLILANGDQLQGTLIAIDDRSVHLERALNWPGSRFRGWRPWPSIPPW